MVPNHAVFEIGKARKEVRSKSHGRTFDMREKERDFDIWKPQTTRIWKPLGFHTIVA